MSLIRLSTYIYKYPEPEKIIVDKLDFEFPEEYPHNFYYRTWAIRVHKTMGSLIPNFFRKVRYFL